MSKHHAQVPHEFIDAPLRGAESLGISRQQIWQTAGLDHRLLAQQGFTISHESYARLMGSLWRECDDEFMGLAKVRSHFGTFSMMCKAIISCTSLEHALQRARQFYALFDHAPNIRLEKDKRLSKIIIEHDTRYDPNFFLAESLLAIWHRLSSWLVGQGIPLLSVSCAYPPPRHHPLYQVLFATPVKFSQSETYLRIPTRMLSLPVSQTPASLRAFLATSPADFLARPNPHESMTGKLRQLFRQYPLEELPALNDTASLLSISGATLRRRLSEEQTSYQKLKDECRLEEASLLLTQADANIRNIAEHLGFTEASTFHRAFKKWQGLTPGEYRAQKLAEKNLS
ncbi:hypothetical protein A3759_00175 [Thalassolituus sp. HI0120]|nr:hypothetical protein A3759_00175 [Thalassolituus sp. HI0120]